MKPFQKKEAEHSQVRDQQGQAVLGSLQVGLVLLLPQGAAPWVGRGDGTPRRDQGSEGRRCQCHLVTYSSSQGDLTITAQGPSWLGKEAATLGIPHSQKVPAHRQVACPSLWGGRQPELRKGVCAFSGLRDQDKEMPLRMSSCADGRADGTAESPGDVCTESRSRESSRQCCSPQQVQVRTAGPIRAPPRRHGAAWELRLNQLTLSPRLLKNVDEILDTTGK